MGLEKTTTNIPFLGSPSLSFTSMPRSTERSKQPMSFSWAVPAGPQLKLWNQPTKTSLKCHGTFFGSDFWKDIMTSKTSKVWNHNPPLLVPPKAGGAENSRGPSIDVGILNNQRGGWFHLWSPLCSPTTTPACTKPLKFYLFFVILVGECALRIQDQRWNIDLYTPEIDTDTKQNWRRYTSYETWLIIVCVCAVFDFSGCISEPKQIPFSETFCYPPKIIEYPHRKSPGHSLLQTQDA